MLKLRIVTAIQTLGMIFHVGDCVMILDTCIINSYVDESTLKAVSIYIDLKRYTSSEIVEALEIIRKNSIIDNIL